MTFEDETPGTSDQQKLATFIWVLHEDLDSVVAVGHELFVSPAYRAFIETLPMAWQEVSAQRNAVTQAVLQANSPALNGVGLAGRQLAAKLEAWYGAREILCDEFDSGGPESPSPFPPLPPPGPIRRLRRALARRLPGRHRRALKWLARCLAHADNILGSLTEVVGMCEPLKELKHAIERVADDTADGLPDTDS